MKTPECKPECDGGVASSDLLAAVEYLCLEKEWSEFCGAIQKAKDAIEISLIKAVNAECSCGGNPAGEKACPACMVYHRFNAGRKAANSKLSDPAQQGHSQT